MKLSYAVENIRRIQKMPDIELKPITVLVGRNSAGKSTYLRSLPLIRQSIETRYSAPILWYGDLVDFGDLEAVSDEKNGDRLVTFRFQIQNLKARRIGRPYPFDRYFSQQIDLKLNKAFVLYTVGGAGDTTKLMEIEVRIPSENIQVRINNDPQLTSRESVKVNEENVNFLSSKHRIALERRHLFSSPLFIVPDEEKEDSTQRLYAPKQIFENEIVEIFRQKVKRKMADRTISKEVRKILACSTLDKGVIENLKNESSTKTLRTLYDEIASSADSDLRYHIQKIHKLSRVFAILELLEDELAEYFLNVRYLGPVRAASERYYRKQELEVSGIAPDGSNFAMFLASLSPEERVEFSDWIKSEFDFGVEILSQVGHISIHLTSNNRSVNITDTGYGMSQMLPVLGMIWWAQSRGGSRRSPRRTSLNIQTLAIEQPELHLHPAHQAKLADIFVSSISAKQQRLRRMKTGFVIETHSEVFIQRLGELIEEGKVDKKSIQIVVFSAADDLGSAAEISTSQFDKNGALKNWPYGFFNYSE